jgi:hypothetical protein
MNLEAVFDTVLAIIIAQTILKLVRIVGEEIIKRLEER